MKISTMVVFVNADNYEDAIEAVHFSAKQVTTPPVLSEDTVRTDEGNSVVVEVQDSEVSEESEEEVVEEERDDVCDKGEDILRCKEVRTPLFIAVEGCDWKRVMTILSEEKGQNQVQTWVSSDTFDCVGLPTWRRLPIHEACRRQAPGYVMEALLKINPLSVQLTTHFQELPIHIACGLGASEEVISILLTAYPDGIVHKDQANRTPIDCFLQARRPRDTPTFRSMERCFAAISERTKAWDRTMEKKVTAHEEKVSALEEALLEQKQRYMHQISSLQSIIAKKESMLNDIKEELNKCQEALELKLQVEATLTETVAQLQNTSEEAILRIANCTLTIGDLNTANAEKDSRIAFLSDKVMSANTRIQSLLEAQQKLEELAVKRRAHAKQEEREWKNMMKVMESQRETAILTSEELLFDE